jgi:hypothetical protein
MSNQLLRRRPSHRWKSLGGPTGDRGTDTATIRLGAAITRITLDGGDVADIERLRQLAAVTATRLAR